VVTHYCFWKPPSKNPGYALDVYVQTRIITQAICDPICEKGSYSLFDRINLLSDFSMWYHPVLIYPEHSTMAWCNMEVIG